MRKQTDFGGVVIAVVVCAALIIAGLSCTTKKESKPADDKTDAGAAISAGPAKAAAEMLTEPADPDEEFRAVFVSTAYNLDWPLKRNLHKSEMITQMNVIIARAKELNANVIILQASAFCDRIYRQSNVTPPVPWAFALNGEDDPDPVARTYDPLREWITACHAEGIEIYAWINPFRVNTLIEVAPDTYLPVIPTEDGEHLYLNPRKQSVQNYIRAVVGELIAGYTFTQMTEPIKAMTAGGGASAEMLLAGDGLDGVLIDHNLPPPDPGDPEYPPTTGPSTGPSALGLPSGAKYLSAAPEVEQVDCKPKAVKPPTARIKWLIKKAGLKPINPDPSVDYPAFVGELYGRVKAAGMTFALSPTCDDERAKGWVQAGWCDVVIPEFYHMRDSAQPNNTFEQELKEWLKLRRSDGSSPLVIAGLFSARTQVPPAGSDVVWPESEVRGQINNSRRVVASGKAARGRALYSWSSLRSPVQAGPVESDNLGESLKKDDGGDDDYSEGAVVPVARPGGTRAKKPVLDSVTATTATWHADVADTGNIFRWMVRLHYTPATGAPHWGRARPLPGGDTGTVTMDGADGIAVAGVRRGGPVGPYAKGP